MAEGTRFGWRDLVRVWSSAAAAGRTRRPTDAIMLVGVVLALVVLARPIVGGVVAPGPVDSGLAEFLGGLPEVATLALGLAYAALSVWGLVLLLLPLAFRGRWSLSATLALVGLVALAGSLVAGSAVGSSRSELWDSFLTVPDAPTYPAVRFAVLTAIITTASPYLARPFRYFGRGLLVAGAVGATAAQVSWASGVLAGFLIGVGAAAVTHLLFGSPQGLLTAEQVEIGLADLGIDARGAVSVFADASGSALWRVTDADGRDLLVKVLGRDAWDTQFAGSVWAALTRRGARVGVGRSREFRVEHEALAGMIADRAGVPVLPLVVVGRSSQGDALIATLAPTWSLANAGTSAGDATAGTSAGDASAGTSAGDATAGTSAGDATAGADIAGEDVDDGDLDAAWRAVLALHATNLAHGGIDATKIVRRPDGHIALADLSDAELTADPGDQQVDRVRLLVATAIAVGRDRAIARAVEALGTDGLIDLLPYLQPAVLDRGTRARVRDLDWSMADLQHDAVALAGVPAPRLLQVRRVSAKSIVVVALVALIAYTLVGVFSGVDLASIASSMQSATWGWVLLALVCSPVIQVFFAYSTIGSTLKHLAYVPVLMLQYAIQFIALVLPATAARLALQVRFFERFGLPPATAVGIGMIDSFSGFLVQIALVVLILLSGLPGFTSAILGGNGGGESSSGGGPSLLLVVAAAVVVGLAVTVAVPRLRRRLVGGIPKMRSRIAEQRRNAGDALQVVRHPRKVATMLLGNLGAQVMQAIVLGICLVAFGGSAHLSQLILINTGVSLFAGLMPVPGGMGVAEAGYTAGLQAIGVPAADAVSVAIAFRLATFYLPPLWGSVAMRWLRRHGYV